MINKIFVTTIPNFLEIQRSSFIWFLLEGLLDELNLFNSFIKHENGEYRFFSNEFILKKKNNNTAIFCKKNKLTYSVSIYLPVNLKNFKYGGIKKQNVFLGEMPLMTKTCTFVINGCERVIINQIIRCPGLYKKVEIYKCEKILTITLVSEKGSWLKFESNRLGFWLRFNKKQKIHMSKFFYYIGLKKEEIKKGFRYQEALMKYEQYENDLKLKKFYNKDGNILEEEIKNLCLMIFNIKNYDLGKIGRLFVNKKLGVNIPLHNQNITLQDIFGILNYFFKDEIFLDDDIDDLRNRRLRSVGELIQNQFRIGLNRIERNFFEMLELPKINKLRFSSFIDSKAISSSLKEFFGTSQLSHYMDQINPLAELCNKRKISSLGPGGLNIDRITVAARDIHPTQYGRICPIETPEGQNVGLVGSLSCYAKVDKKGFIKTPYFQVKNGKILKNKPPIYLTANQEEEYKIASNDSKINENGFIDSDFVVAKFKREFVLLPIKEIDFISVSPIQILSLAASLIPFLEHNDANRALMGANMQRQAVPLLYPRKPIVGTGLEPQVAIDSGLLIFSLKSGVVKFVSSNEIIIKNFDNTETNYKLNKYEPSNQDTSLNQKPIVWVGENIKKGQLLVDGPAIDEGELALGQNLTVAYMSWEGFNYEDSILISDRLVYENVLTSVHIEKYETEIRETKTGNEILTIKIPFVESQETSNLDANAIICKGSLVMPGDILVGKVTPKTEHDQLPEARLLKAIFGYKIPEVKDTSLKTPSGVFGRVLDIKIFKEDNKTDFIGVNSSIQIFIAQIRKIGVGDKIAGRHGNKGVVSKIVPHQDMPFLPDGTIVDIILNPLGVPSRMNVGQIYECLLGLAADSLDKRFHILPFDEIFQNQASRVLINQKLKEAAQKRKKSWLYNSYSPGKFLLSDGRTGENFRNPILVGCSYIVKLVHLVDDKIHARSTGSYSLITQQPVGGRSLIGGQRFGEMEVWALEAYGSAYTLQELLTIKSDDLDARDELLNAIVCGQKLPKSGLPESFKVLIRELQSLGLDIKTYRIHKDNENQIITSEIDLMKTYETDML